MLLAPYFFVRIVAHLLFLLCNFADTLKKVIWKIIKKINFITYLQQI